MPAHSPRACCSFRPGEHRSRADAARRHPGHRAGPRRRDDRHPPARGRPQPVQARRHHHHLGTGGLYPPLVPIAQVVKLDDDGAVALPLADPATTSFAIVEPPFEPAAVAAEAPADRGALMVRSASRSGAADRPGAPHLRRLLPAATVIVASLLAALPIVSTTGWWPDSASSCCIGWRLLRADPWPAWWAAPLGLVNDLFTGIRSDSRSRCGGDDAGDGSPRPPHDVARLLDRMGACGAASSRSTNGCSGGSRKLGRRRVPTSSRMVPP